MSPKRSVMFFSRGRGYGHAVPDMAIGSRLAQSFGFDVQYVSYAAGAVAFRAWGVTVLDLGFSENNPYSGTLVESFKLINRYRPDVVLVHEEFATLVAAYMCKVPAVFISDWVPPRGGMAAESLRYASAIVIFEEPGVFHVDYPLLARPRFVGPFVRDLKYTQKDRGRARRELSISEDTFVVLVCPGGSVLEERAPIAHIVVPAFAMLNRGKKHMYWITESDYDYLNRITSAFPEITVTRFLPDIHRFMIASDLVLTRGTRVTTIEAAALGVPSIGLSFGMNPMDDLLSSRVKSNILLNARALDPDVLRDYMEEMGTKIGYQIESVNEATVAELLAEEISRITDQ